MSKQKDPKKEAPKKESSKKEAPKKESSKKESSKKEIETKSAQKIEGRTRLKKKFTDKIVPMLQKQFAYDNVMQVPKIQKITLNMGVGKAADDKKIIKFAQDNLTQIAGQKAVVTHARISVAGFKIREGWPIGCKVTLRGERMYEFLDRLLSIALPRVRDFRGLNPRSFDSRGNYSLGIKEQITFPEIDYNQVDTIRGLDITITTSAKTDEEAFALLKAFNFPFREIKTAEVKTNG